ncbi:MAG TPA: uracil phosphoribosyltransferase [Flavobacteriales bacterium]|jgi:uracil phosphoribosyltransferase|nr:uracil phosphoribosyltransferase [Flavobacteriales bacterium]HPH82818.1 uracil phosphoribosyltransferase [Flavobacteriales bacterium]
MSRILSNENSLVNVFISELRDETIQKDSMRFRRNLERLGEIIAYEISKHLEYSEKEVTTPLGIANVPVLKDQPVIATILRAGLPVHQGMLNYFDQAGNAFVSAYRKHHKDNTFEIKVEYMSSPDLNDKVLIICDPMLATGQSMLLAYKALIQRGKPRHVHVVGLIASVEGLTYVKSHFPENTTFWMGAVDDELTVKSYIVPGLGDAGDLAYGTKI